MPELPEVETTKNIISPIIQNQTIQEVIIYQSKLRWPINKKITTILPNNKFINIRRRGKYLLLETNVGTLIIHLGMTGCLKYLTNNTPLIKHDHVEIKLKSKTIIRYNDPRKFGFIIWTTEPAELHPLLSKLGPEPLTQAFNSKYLFDKCQSSSKPIKNLIMDNSIVVGVGNIYATESLFSAKILPFRKSNTLKQLEVQLLVKEIKKILRKSIKSGGTTLKDFYSPEGKPGYFKQKLKIYGKKGENCYDCNTSINQITLMQRTTTYCPNCQN
ncbi:MAG: bifunctional DNA-formamidopyrimidine glycosylase/DNA-(apurinic or apyrimidinic site) lyase [Legionellales bacterium]|nr:bifunctional DNA-formamidopyrimidine glycosylase/DNA-(apurinic or apyrimidinic site) lyase [Legionellales bacterium]